MIVGALLAWALWNIYSDLVTARNMSNSGMIVNLAPAYLIGLAIAGVGALIGSLL
ncbi:hypothetical protein [Novosphingobium sp.]|uniref:hypothetical protein n=1 Tax=Novosphingobium sp. TaxID=1874826 RepID=UPI003D6CB496